MIRCQFERHLLQRGILQSMKELLEHIRKQLKSGVEEFLVCTVSVKNMDLENLNLLIMMGISE